MKTLPFKSLQSTTYKSLGMRPAKKLTVLSNPCHDEQGRFCNTTSQSGESTVSKSEKELMSKLKRAKDHGKKDKIFYDANLSKEDSDRLVMAMITTVPKGQYKLHSREYGVNIRDVIYDMYGNMPSNILSESVLLGASIRYPKKVRATFTHDMDKLTVLSENVLSAHTQPKPKPGSKPRLVKINGLLAHQASSRIDPTRTTGLRNRWAAEMGRRFTALRRLIWKTIVDDDCFGIGPAYEMYRPAAYSNPCHDEQGRFCSTGGGSDQAGGIMKMFHGTSSDYIDSIKEHGLIPGKTQGGDSWAAKQGWNDCISEIGSQKVSVYMTNKLRIADQYARYAAEMSGGVPVILEVVVPKSFIGKLSKDEKDSDAIKFNGKIKPDWITRIISQSEVSPPLEGPSIVIRKKSRMISLSQDQSKVFYIATIVDNQPVSTTHTLSTPIIHIKFDFPRLEDKIPAFMQWLQQQQDEGILELVTLPRMGQSLGEPWTNMFVKDSYERGVIRAREQLMSAGYGTPGLGAGELPLLGLPGMTSGVLANPFHVDRLASVYLRAYDGLKGISNAMSMQISHVLAQGLADGDNPITLAKKMNYVISGMGKDMGITDSLGRFIPAERRAKMLARTEVIRSHAQAQLQEFKVWGVAGVDVVAEWVTAGFNVCPQCQDKSRQGPYTIEQAWNLIPFHPHCRCCWVAKPRNELYVHSNPCHDERGRFCSTGGGSGGATVRTFLTPETAEEFLNSDARDVGIFNLYSDRWLRSSDGEAKEYAYEVARNSVMLQRALQVEHFKSQDLPEQVDLYRVGPAHGGQGSVVSFWPSKSAAESYQEGFRIESIHKYQAPLDSVVPSRSGAGELWANVNEIRQVD